jgi:uncharacterized protein YggE
LLLVHTYAKVGGVPLRRFCGRSMVNSIGAISSIAVLFLIFQGVVQGQGTTAQTPSLVSASGIADITKAPEVIRLQLKQYGKGNDTESARLALLAAEKKLIKAVNDCGAEIIVATAGASFSSAYRARYASDMQMIQQRRNIGGVNPVEPPKPAPTILERIVVVDLKPGAKQKEILSLVVELQEKMRKDITELSGLTAVWTDEQNAEAPREMAQRGDYYVNQSDLRISLAARISKKERQILLAEAFKRARATAQELAQAAEGKLGRLHTLSATNVGMGMTYNPAYSNNTSALILANGEVMRRTPFQDDPETEISIMRPFNYAQGGQYEPLTFQVGIQVSYQLEGAK